MSTTNRSGVVSDQFQADGKNVTENSHGQTYGFTLDNPRLTPEQREFYELNGYIVIRNLVPHELLDQCSQRFQDICNGKVGAAGMSIVKDISMLKSGATGERLVNKIQDVMSDHVLSQYFTLPKILQVVSCFTGPNIKAHHTQVVNKPSDNGSGTSRHPLHQDLNFFPIRPADRIVCAWTAIDRVTRENGCLSVVPGSHRGPLLEHDYPQWQNGVNKLYHGILAYEDYSHQRVHVEMEKGDCIFFHPLLIHGSGANRTQHYRKAITCHYGASECHYVDLHGTVSERYVKEIEQIGWQKGIPGTFNGFFASRSRLVAGAETKAHV